jgi:hypothetical protein
MSAFCRRSRLLSLLASDVCPPVLRSAWAAVKDDFNPEDLDLVHPLAGLPRTESRRGEPGSLPDDIFEAFVALLFGCNAKGDTSHLREVLFHHWHIHSGVLYSDFRTSTVHHLVYFRPACRAQSNSRPAEVRAIFSRKYRNEKHEVVDEVFFAVHEYISSGHRAFASFGDFRADIYHLEPDNDVQVIRATQVSCPANQQPWSNGLVTMRAVDRVGSGLSTIHFSNGRDRNIRKVFGASLYHRCQTHAVHPMQGPLRHFHLVRSMHPCEFALPSPWYSY